MADDKLQHACSSQISGTMRRGREESGLPLRSPLVTYTLTVMWMQMERHLGRANSTPSTRPSAMPTCETLSCSTARWGLGGRPLAWSSPAPSGLSWQVTFSLSVHNA